MFEKSLTDLIRGLRANKNSEERFVANAIDEVRQELRTNDLDIKTNAISKLCVLHMMGYDMSWASFHIIEVMSSSKLSQKRVGYYAASISFKQDTDVLMLCTNLIKKDMSSNNYEDGAVAMHALAQIATPDLSRDLHMDLIVMLNHSKPYMRKRAILVLYRIFLKYPEALRAAFSRLKERLNDDDPSVVSAAVNVICELARKNPKSYLPLAPQLYGLLTTSNNNWMLIKTIKLFAALTPLEPRLVRKLVPPIVNLIQSTSAMSLVYECIHTLIVGGMITPESTTDQSESSQDRQIVLLCVTKLRKFLEDSDQNLKYLGLYALGKLLILRPSAVGEHREIILRCLEDPDYSIRQRALELIQNLSTPTHLFAIVKKLMMHLVPKTDTALSKRRTKRTLGKQENIYRNSVAQCILTMCSKDTFANVTNFEWYLSVLIDLSYCPLIDAGSAISEQFIQICVRVPEIVPLAVSSLAKLVMDTEFLDTVTKQPNNTEALYGAVWVVGEYCNVLSDPQKIIKSMLLPQVNALSPLVHTVYLHNLLKVYARWIGGHLDGKDVKRPETDECLELIRVIIDRLEFFTTSPNLEVQDRASTVLEIFKLIIKEIDLSREETQPLTTFGMPRMTEILPTLFDGEFNPVSIKSQGKVVVPEGLDLDSWIHPPELEAEEFNLDGSSNYSDVDSLALSESPTHSFEQNERHQRRQEKQQNDPFYLTRSETQSKSTSSNILKIDVDKIPIAKLSLDTSPLAFGGLPSSLSSPSKYTSLFAKSRTEEQIRGEANAFNMGQSSPKTYQLKQEEDLPSRNAQTDMGDNEGHKDLLEDLEHIRLTDPDRYAVMSIDLTLAGDDNNSASHATGFSTSDKRAPRHSKSGLMYEALPDTVDQSLEKLELKSVKKKKTKKSAVDATLSAEEKGTKKSKKKSKSKKTGDIEESDKKKKSGKAKSLAHIPEQAITPQVTTETHTVSALLSGAIGVSTEPIVFFEDDFVEIMYMWQHVGPLTDITATQLQLSIMVSIAIRPIETSAITISTCDVNTVSAVSINQLQPCEYEMNLVATRTESHLEFQVPDISMEIAYTYVTTDESLAKKMAHTVDLTIPPTVNMISRTSPTVMEMTASGMVELLTSDPPLLSLVHSTQMVLPSSVVFDVCIEMISARLCLGVVETHTTPARAVSMYGVSLVMNGVHVAALVKDTSAAGPGMGATPPRRKRGLIVNVDLRCGHAGVLKLLADMIQNICAELVESRTV
ncbi:hypothetical protein BDV3_004946 [Batrachochytrium dendrobatidis]